MSTATPALATLRLGDVPVTAYRDGAELEPALSPRPYLHPVPGDPWFLRVEDYPGVGVQLAARDAVTVSSGDRLTRGLRVVLADGPLAADTLLGWMDEKAQDPDCEE